MNAASLTLALLIITATMAAAQTPTPAADINNDGIVDAADLLLMMDQWQSGAAHTPTPTHSPTHTPTRTPSPTATNILPEIVIDLPDLAANSKPLIMVRIPAGSFQMGCDVLQYNIYSEPVHSVTIAYDFYISKYEVTEAQWEAVAQINPASGALGPDYPAPVSWYECQDFIAQLNTLGQGTFRLPSEAEWEYACRAGSTTLFYFGDIECNPPNHGGRICNLDYYAWWINNCLQPPFNPRPVGLLAPNAYGLYDMHGNMFEWCQDWFHDNYNGAPNDGSAWESPSATYRSTRSGAYWTYDWECASAGRMGHKLDSTGNSLRLVRDIQ